MSPRPDVSEERKQQILDAAIAVFARLGFRSARMDDVAEQAGEFYAIAGRDKGVRQFLKEYFADYRRLLARLIERGIAQSELRDIDAKATAIMLTALFEGLALLFFVDPEATRWADQTETSMRLLLSGL